MFLLRFRFKGIKLARVPFGGQVGVVVGKREVRWGVAGRLPRLCSWRRRCKVGLLGKCGGEDGRGGKGV